MRFLSYAVAVLVAAGLIYYVGQNPNTDTETATETAGVASSAEAGTADGAELEGQLITLHVPKMHCPFACYPAVKETLEKTPGVVTVVLAEQKDENAIDNPEVKIQVSEDFDAEAAIAALASAGFSDSTKVQ